MNDGCKGQLHLTLLRMQCWGHCPPLRLSLLTEWTAVKIIYWKCEPLKMNAGHPQVHMPQSFIPIIYMLNLTLKPALCRTIEFHSYSEIVCVRYSRVRFLSLMMQPYIEFLVSIWILCQFTRAKWVRRLYFLVIITVFCEPIIFYCCDFFWVWISSGWVGHLHVKFW